MNSPRWRGGVCDLTQVIDSPHLCSLPIDYLATLTSLFCLLPQKTSVSLTLCSSFLSIRLCLDSTIFHLATALPLPMPKNGEQHQPQEQDPLYPVISIKSKASSQLSLAMALCQIPYDAPIKPH